MASPAPAAASEKPLAQSLGTLTAFLENRILDNKRLNDENATLQLRVAALLTELHDKELEFASLTTSLRAANEKVALLEGELQRQREHHTAALLAHATPPAAHAPAKVSGDSPERSAAGHSNATSAGGSLLGSLGSSGESLTTAPTTTTTTTTVATATTAVAPSGSDSGTASPVSSSSASPSSSTDSNQASTNAAALAERAKKKGWRMSRPAGGVAPLKQVVRDLHGNHVGWMYKYKLGTRFKQAWKRRYFVLSDTHLCYYTNPTAEGKPQGSMEIACLTINPRVSIDVDLGDKNWYFSVVEDMSIIDPGNEQRRDYIFAADTEEEMTEWITLLQSAKKGVHRQAKHALGAAAAANTTTAPAAAAAAAAAATAATAATPAVLPDLSVPTVVTTTVAKPRTVTDEW